MRKFIQKTGSSILRPPAFAYCRSAVAGALTLFCEKSDLARLAERHCTPLYVYSAEMIRSRLIAFDRAFRTIPHTLCYSVKANSTLAILRLVAQEGAGFDVVSGGELERVLRVEPKATGSVVFSGVGKTVPEMELALRAGILLFNVESGSELRALAATAARLKKKAAIAVRVNPDVSAKTHPYISTGLHEHKFGVPIPEARKLYAEAAKHPNLHVAGVSVHIGSQITDLSSFGDALRRVAALVRELRGAGHDIRYVDAGGGLGITYHGAQEPFTEQVSAYAKTVIEPLRKLDVHLLLEPGRSIVGPAGVLLTRVIYRKTNDGKRFLIVDAAMNDLLRPSLYGAHHEIVPVRQLAQGSRRSEAAQNSRQSEVEQGSKRSEGVQSSRRFGVAQRFSAAISSESSTVALAAEVGKVASGSPPSADTELTDVVGPICETGDFFARDRELPVMQEGDLLAILDAGAYASVLGSNYNTRGRGAEVLVEGARARLIRRRESVADQTRMELI